MGAITYSKASSSSDAEPMPNEQPTMSPSVSLLRQRPVQRRQGGPTIAAHWHALPAHPSAYATMPASCLALPRHHDASPIAWNEHRPILRSGEGATRHPQKPLPMYQTQAPSPGHSCGGASPQHQWRPPACPRSAGQEPVPLSNTQRSLKRPVSSRRGTALLSADT
eukprot:5051595-Karenia_brevis.AAC.1